MKRGPILPPASLYPFKGLHPHMRTPFPYLPIPYFSGIFQDLWMDWRKQRSGPVNEHRGCSELRRGGGGSGDWSPWPGRGLTYAGSAHPLQPRQRLSLWQTFGLASWKTLVLSLSIALFFTIQGYCGKWQWWVPPSLISPSSQLNEWEDNKSRDWTVS